MNHIPIKEIPFDPGRPITGYLKEFQADKFTMQMSMLKKMGSIYKFNVGRHEIIYLAEPTYIRHILQTNYKNYVKNFFYDELKVILGKGLVTSEGEYWRKHRKMIQPAIHHKQIRQFQEIMVDSTKKLILQWEKQALEKTPVNIEYDMRDLTLEIVVKCLFSQDTNIFSKDASYAVNIVLEWSKKRMESYAKMPKWIPTKSNREFHEAFSFLQSVIKNIIQNRRKMNSRPDDLLTSLIELTDEESNVGMDDQQLFDEILTLFIAGHETTAHTMVWTWYLLSLHPQVREKLQNELDSVFTGNEFSSDMISQLQYCKMVIKESMRYIPSVWGIGREALEDDTIDGFAIPKGATVGVSIFQMHHHPDYWENPEGFDPERFHPVVVNNLNKWVYMPFGAGPRMCIGNAFAMMESQIILSIISKQFQLNLRREIPVEFESGITLRPKNALLMDVIKR